MARQNATVYRVTAPFCVLGPDGVPRVVTMDALIDDDDPIVRTHRAFLQPVSDFVSRPGRVEQATSAPGEFRHVQIPSKERIMPHVLPPEDPRSPASTFAPAQPAAGVVADDVAEKGQNLAGGPTASEASGSKQVAEAVEAHTDNEPVASSEAKDPHEAAAETEPKKSAKSSK